MGAYDVNYEDERFAKVEEERQAALSENDRLYNNMVGEAGKYYREQQEALGEWGEKQQQLQQERSDFTVEQIEQQKEQAAKDYKKEQQGAYVDWQKQSGKYGVEAEKTASSGLSGTGYSESSQVSMYNAYQIRVAAARESYNQAVLSYDNAIKDAKLQNDSALAELAYQTLREQLDLSLQGFQYKNQLLLDQANRKTELDSLHYSRYQDVLNQINTENAQKEAQRQWQAEYEQSKKAREESARQWKLEFERLKENDAYSRSLNEAELAASLGDYSKLEALGIDTSKAGTVSDTSDAGKTLPTGYIDELEELANPASTKNDNIGKTKEEILTSLLKKADYWISAGYSKAQINTLLDTLVKQYGLDEPEEEDEISVPNVPGSTYKSGAGGGGSKLRDTLVTDSGWI